MAQTYDIGKIRAGETFQENVFLLEKQPFLYLVHYFGRGCRRQRQYRYAGQLLPYVGNMEIGRAEVIAPLRDAMAFVYHQDADVHGSQLFFEEAGGKAFGRDIQKLVLSGNASLQFGRNLLVLHARIDSRSFDPDPAQIVDLVAHQSDKRRDD